MKKQITVRELIALLEDCDQVARVFVEGCDCVGQAVGVDTTTSGEVLITRGIS